MMRKNKTTLRLEDLPSGLLPYTLMNDFLAKAVMQRNAGTLKGLVAALQSIPLENIKDIQIMNPIELGKSVKDKDCILDLKVLFNNNTILNIEIQIFNLENWPERSLTYLCRIFDQTKSGGDYGDILPSIHIGILDFNLNHLTPKFYSEFKMMETKNHEIYSDKFILRVLNLKTLEDDSIMKEPADLYEWALLFKAKTWEDLKMLAEKNDYFTDTIMTLHEMTAEERIREQCEAREKYNWDMASAIRKGQREGLAEGLVKGETLKLISQVCRKLAKGDSPEKIADDLVEDPATIKHICDVVNKLDPPYDIEAIYGKL